jgi:hypothetical protein
VRHPEEIHDSDLVAYAPVMARVAADWRCKAIVHGRFVLWALRYGTGILGVRAHWPLHRTGGLVLGLAACVLYTGTAAADWRLWTPFCRGRMRAHRRAAASQPYGGPDHDMRCPLALSARACCGIPDLVAAHDRSPAGGPGWQSPCCAGEAGTWKGRARGRWRRAAVSWGSRAPDARRTRMYTLLSFITHAVVTVLCGGMVGLLLLYVQASLVTMPPWVVAGGMGIWGLAIASAVHPRRRERRVWLLTRLGSLFAMNILTVIALPVYATVLGTWTPGAPLTPAALQGPPTGDAAFDQLSAHLETLVGWVITASPLLFGACAVSLVLLTLCMEAGPSAPTSPGEDTPC